ncbi:helix-turn-helix transcriptional regulator [Modestobacter sp. L9-4]|uniref:winged helix-turn-helix transcriptional regulator n=1 Tax=Modestobacter sp. L9-4 TaxID=2851567 RepID=UPI001C767B56|nr:helix-turn-helix domain-containing protein [Modestobacter sp. L9-4]QXG76831.1 helix-turn-helix transcriptional regulator [Modestobacter sp. L9-4]
MSTSQQAADVFSRHCPSREVFEDVTGKWAVLVLSALHQGPHRFGELRRRVDGVSEKMLSQTLQVLERDGLVHREVRSATPPHVEYSLTGLGAGLAPRLLALIGFVEDALPQVLAARTARDDRG